MLKTMSDISSNAMPIQIFKPLYGNTADEQQTNINNAKVKSLLKMGNAVTAAAGDNAIYITNQINCAQNMNDIIAKEYIPVGEYNDTYRQNTDYQVDTLGQNTERTSKKKVGTINPGSKGDSRMLDGWKQDAQEFINSDPSGRKPNSKSCLASFEDKFKVHKINPLGKNRKSGKKLSENINFKFDHFKVEKTVPNSQLTNRQQRRNINSQFTQD